LAVVDIDAIQDKDNLEFVVGVGVKSLAEAEIGTVGYDTIEVIDLIHDVLYEDRNYDAESVLRSVVKRVGRFTKYVPLFKYLAAYGIKTLADYEQSGLELDKWVKIDLAELRLKAYAGLARPWRASSVKEVVMASTPENAAAIIPFLSLDKICIDELREFLLQHIEKFDPNISSYASHFKKLATLYDRLKWGWR
jgi:hypothetical protein